MVALKHKCPSGHLFSVAHCNVHEPYMPWDKLDNEIAAGIVFWGYEEDSRLVGVMGFQSVRDVNLIRHAYTCQ